MTTLTSIPAPQTHQQTSDPTTAPASSTGTARIALGAPADLAALRAAALHAARARIDAHLPPASNISTSTTSAPAAATNSASAGADAATAHNGSAAGDALRTAVERTVDAWLSTLFSSIRPNVDVNGLPGTSAALDDALEPGAHAADQSRAGAGASASAQYEPYDAALAGRVVGLHAQIEALQAELAGRRREGAAAAAEAFRGEFAALQREHEHEHEHEHEDSHGHGHGHGHGSGRQDGEGDAGLAEADRVADVPFAARADGVAARFEDAVRQVGGIGAGFAGSRARAEEAVRVARYMDGHRYGGEGGGGDGGGSDAQGGR